MQTKLTERLKKSNNFLIQYFGTLILSLFLSFSHILYAQEEETISFDESVVKNGESLFKGNCTVCHGIDDVVIDDVLLVSRDYELYLMGLELDYSYDDFESMFKFNNPKAKSTCGCGTSFSVGM